MIRSAGTAFLALVVTGGVSASDMNHRTAVGQARALFPDAIVVEVEDELYQSSDPEETYEIDMITADGATLIDIEFDRFTGQVNSTNMIPQSGSEQDAWMVIIDLVPGTVFDFRHAYNRALDKYPDAAIKEIDLDLELGALEFDVFMRDVHGNFQIEVDAITGDIDGDDPRGLTLWDAIEIAEDSENGRPVFAKYVKVNGERRVRVKMAKNNGNKEVRLDLDIMTGAVLVRNVKTVTGTKQQDYQQILQNWGNLQTDIAQALIAGRKELGGGRVLQVNVVWNEQIEFKTKLKVATRVERVWIDEVGAVVDRQ